MIVFELVERWRDMQEEERIAREYETRKDRQRSENQFVCSPVG